MRHTGVFPPVSRRSGNTKRPNYDAPKHPNAPAKRIAIAVRFLKCNRNIFIENRQIHCISLLLKHIIVTLLPSREMQLDSCLLVSVGDTGICAAKRTFELNILYQDAFSYALEIKDVEWTR